jgi:hypothetical protein
MKTLKYFVAIAVSVSGLALSANALMLKDIGGDQNAPQTSSQAFLIAQDFEALFGMGQTLVFSGGQTITTGLDQPIDLSGFCVALASFGPGEFVDSTFAVWDIIGPPTPSTVTFPQQDPVSGGGAITTVYLFKCAVPETGGTMLFLSLSLMPLIATRMIGRSTRQHRAA